MLKKLPLSLIILRVLIGCIIVLMVVFNSNASRTIIAVLTVVGLLTDIFDGIVARRLNVSTLQLRRLDSTTDQFFWLCVIGATYIMCPAFYSSNAVMMFVLIGAEALTYVVSFIKFRKEVATHAIASKAWALVLLATLVQVVITCNARQLFIICFYLGIATRLEIILILLVLKEWSSDVPSIYHAFLLRKGKPIKRNKLFNG